MGSEEAQGAQLIRTDPATFAQGKLKNALRL